MSTLSENLCAELQATCSALGYLEDGKYYKEHDCLDSLRDLIRFLRRDDADHGVRRWLGDGLVLQTDLLPLLRDHHTNKDIFEVVLRLLVNLTTAPLLLWHLELPEEKVSRNYFLEIQKHLQAYKQLFCDDKIWVSLYEKLSSLIQKDPNLRLEDDQLNMERILILIRNILHVPADPEAERRTDDDATVHDQVLYALHLSGMEDLLLFISTSTDEQQLCLHVLEIISLMLRDQEPPQLAQTGVSRSDVQKKKDEEELRALREREEAKKKMATLRLSGRHSRFRGTYCVKNLKSITDKDVIYHKEVPDVSVITFDPNKKRMKKPKNRAPLQEQDLKRRSTLAIRLFLKELCVEFLQGAYNTIMHTVKDNLQRNRTQENDETYYMWAIRFFMEFNRYNKFKVEYVSETMSISTVHYLQTQLDNYLGMMTTDKKKISLWSRRMHLALRAYQELIMTMMAMDRSSDEGVRESSRVIKSNLIYVDEYRDLPLILFANYDEIKMTKSYLRDLVETNHAFIKLLEQFNKEVGGRAVVRDKVKKKSKKKKSVAAVPAAVEDQEMVWDHVEAQLSQMLSGELPVDAAVVPFDAALEVSVDDQKSHAMWRVQRHMKKKEVNEALSLFRAARDVWSEGDPFGASDISPEEELLALREVFFTEIPRPEGLEMEEEEVAPQANAYEASDEEDEEEERGGPNYEEKELNVKNFISRFASTKVVAAYSLLLCRYQQNTTFTNHCIVKMFHRLAWDCGLPALFFQACIFRCFQKILSDPVRMTNAAVKELAKFAKYIIAKFLEIQKTNSKIFMEMLFWKSNKDAQQIQDGYAPVANKKKFTIQWTEQQEEELQRLYEEFQNKQEEGKDVVDHILENMIADDKTRRAVIKKLKLMGLVTNTRELNRKTVRTKATREWTQDECQELQYLYKEHKDAQDPMGMILLRLSVPRPKARVIEKMLELGLVQDRKELRKKRPKKGEDAGKNRFEEEDDLLPTTESSSDEEGPSRRPPPRRVIPQVMAVPVDSSDVTTVLQQVINKGFLEALRWLGNSLRMESEDRAEEDADIEAVSLIPLQENAAHAMEDAEFQTLLGYMGIKPPQNEQESWWRIPADLTVADLDNRIGVINKALEGDFSPPEEPLINREVVEEEAQTLDNRSGKRVAATSPEHQPAKKKLSTARVESSSEDEDPFEKLKAFRNNREAAKENMDGGGTSSDDELTKQATKKRRTKNENKELGTVKQTKSGRPATSRRIVVDSSDDDASMAVDDDDNAAENSDMDVNLDSDNEEEKTAGKTKRRVLKALDSSDDEGTITSTNSVPTTPCTPSQRSDATTPSQSQRTEATTPSQSQRTEATTPSKSQRSEATTPSKSQRSEVTTSSQSQRSEATTPSQSQRSEATTPSQSQRSEATTPSQSQRSEATTPSQSQRSEATTPSRSQRSRATTPSQSQPTTPRSSVTTPSQRSAASRSRSASPSRSSSSSRSSSPSSSSSRSSSPSRSGSCPSSPSTVCNTPAKSLQTTPSKSTTNSPSKSSTQSGTTTPTAYRSPKSCSTTPSR